MTDADQAKAGVEATPAKSRRMRRSRIGVVESDMCQKTIKVRIDRLSKHQKYGKYLKRRTTLMAHDEKDEAKIGDMVEIVECRPISKMKSWRLSRIVRKAAEV